MQKTDKAIELEKIAQQLDILRDIRPDKFYECKGRIDALFEVVTEKKALVT
ncbi:hypothetical protein [Clostridium saccharoperbutylacetonicum]|uniref:hypothetical protein n=1 Tax=Clostridium saccharoperbutylacetonicum TaxID=36745 RepID=UPI0039ECE9B2